MIYPIFRQDPYWIYIYKYPIHDYIQGIYIYPILDISLLKLPILVNDSLYPIVFPFIYHEKSVFFN